MTQSKILNRNALALAPEPLTLPPLATQVVGIALALSVSAVHITDQGGLTDFAAPDWLGWAYRLIEVGGVLVALTLMWPRLARLGLGRRSAARCRAVGRLSRVAHGRRAERSGRRRELVGLGRHPVAGHRGRADRHEWCHAMGPMAPSRIGRSHRRHRKRGRAHA